MSSPANASAIRSRPPAIACQSEVIAAGASMARSSVAIWRKASATDGSSPSASDSAESTRSSMPAAWSQKSVASAAAVVPAGSDPAASASVPLVADDDSAAEAPPPQPASRTAAAAPATAAGHALAVRRTLRDMTASRGGRDAGVECSPGGVPSGAQPTCGSRILRRGRRGAAGAAVGRRMTGTGRPGGGVRVDESVDESVDEPSHEPMDDLIARMVALQAALEADEDPARYFLGTYLRTTQAVRAALAEDLFEDPAWMARWDVDFAGLYLDALEAHRRDPAAAPAPWREAFGARASLQPQGPVRLGVNAPTTFALPQSLVRGIPEVEFSDPVALAGRERDHERIDRVLSSRVTAEDAELQHVG